MPGAFKTDSPRCDDAMNEQRPATPPQSDHLDGDDKGVVVPSTEELTSLTSMDDFEIEELLLDAASGIEDGVDDWAQQYECILAIRRVVVYAPACFDTQSDDFISALLSQLTLAADNLRSALVKNALLALAECFEFLPRGRLSPLVDASSSRRGGTNVMDMLLRRCVCEKKFLRDAAMYAVTKLVEHLASIELMANAAQFAANKNARLCAQAARIMATSLELLVREQKTAKSTITAVPNCVYQALAALREGKDTSARARAASSFKLLGQLLGRETFELGLSTSLNSCYGTGSAQQLVAARILKESFPSASSIPESERKERRGSLRDRVLAEKAGC